MKVAQISDLANLADGSVIGEMRVTIKATFPPKTGEGKFGPWRVQNCVLQDATGECRASFWIADEMGDLKGQMVTLKSQAGKKGLQGISVKHSTHSGENELKITDQCAIIDDAGAAVAQAGPRKPVQASSPVSLTVADAKRALFQAAQLMAEAIKAAEWVGGQASVTPEQLQAIATSLFISADRAGFAKAFPSAQTKPAAKKDEPVELEEDDLKW
jgi:hypothetical protein